MKYLSEEPRDVNQEIFVYNVHLCTMYTPIKTSSVIVAWTSVACILFCCFIRFLSKDLYTFLFSIHPAVLSILAFGVQQLHWVILLFLKLEMPQENIIKKSESRIKLERWWRKQQSPPFIQWLSLWSPNFYPRDIGFMSTSIVPGIGVMACCGYMPPAEYVRKSL